MLKNIKLVAIIAAIATTLFFVNDYVSTKREVIRLSDNNKSLTMAVEDSDRKIHVNDSINGAKVLHLQLSNEELKTSSIIDKQLINDLGIENKRLKTYAETHTKTEYVFERVFEDTVIYRDTALLAMKVLTHKTEWVDIRQELYPDFSTKIDLKIYDKIHYIEDWEPVVDLWLFTLGNKRVNQTILSMNPDTEIVEAIFIENKKKRRKR